MFSETSYAMNGACASPFARRQLVLATSCAPPTLEQWADSLTAVLDDLRSSEAVLLANNGASTTAALFAATHPSRTTALVVLEGYARSPTEGVITDEFFADVLATWGTGHS